jgi:hypothetical protein
VRGTAALLAGAFVACAAAAFALFPRAFPLIALDQRLTVATAEQRADAFAHAHELPWNGERIAARFDGDGSVQTFLDLTGGADTVRAVARGTDHALYAWHVRRFSPGVVQETNVSLAPDGRVIGFMRKFADVDVRPALVPDSAQRLAERVRDDWLGEPPSRWRLATTSYETKKESGRIDRTFTFERTDRQLLGAPLRLKVIIAGDTPSSAAHSVAVPEKFERRYTEMRAANNLLAGFASAGAFLLMIAAAWTLRRFSRAGGVRWREAGLAGAIIGVLLLAAAVNGMPLAWYDYDTASSPTVFFATTTLAELAGALVMAIVVGLTLAAAEASSRQAFPSQLDWWKWWPVRGTRAVAGRVAGGYVMAAAGIAYVSLFYIVTRKFFGWWVPTELLDDPNQIATRLPFLAGIANSLQAGVWEEALFRALPLSLLALWVGDRPHRLRWMAAGVVGTALVFGFAHANYQSWPAYSRGVEIFFDACLWGALVVWLGPLTTMVGHFLYDLFLFGMFASAGTAPAYRITAAVTLLVLLAPALAVAWKVWRQRGLVDAGDDARFASWRPGEAADDTTAAATVTPSRLTPRLRTIAMALGAAGLVLTLSAPRRPVLGPEVTTSRAGAIAVADSMLTARGIAPLGWTRLARIAHDTMDATWPRFLKAEHSESLATRFATTYEPAAWWIVRYVHPHAGIEARAEEWRVRVWPDGRPLDVRHVLPDAAWRDSVAADEARVLARGAMARAALDTTRFVEADLVADKKTGDSTKVQRKDVTLTYTDTTVRLPGGALARVWVSIAGNEVTLVRRGIELPESFLRADRKTQLLRGAIAGGVLLLLVGFVIGGATYARNRRRAVLDDRYFTKRRAIVAASLLGVLSIVSSLNGLPVQLASYDTAETWRAFVANTGLTTLVSLVLVAFIVGLWMAFDGLRRRVGIPLFPHDDAPWPNTVAAAIGLAGLQAAIGGASTWFMTPGIPDAPTTSLDVAVPALAGALSLPLGIAMGVLFVAIPAMVILLLVRTTRSRVALTLALGALGGGAVLAIGGRTPAAHPLVLATIALISLPAMFYALRAYAATSAATWALCVTLQMALGATRSAIDAPTMTERIGAVVTLAALAGIVLLERRLVAAQARPPAG